MAAELSSRAGVPSGAAPDPGRVVTQEDFGHELSLARMRASLTVRQAARAAGLPISTAGDYFSGRHLPPSAQTETLRALLAACGISDPDEVAAWAAALGRARRAPGRRPADAVAPYRGLAAFQPEDAEWFFGREDLTGLLMTAALADKVSGVPLVVTGPSGSGKSSLLRAGLVPRLRAGSPGQPPGGWRVVMFTPGASPAGALAAQLAAAPGEAAGHAGDGHGLAGTGLAPDADEGPGLAVIVDQFEEVFVACQDEKQRREFIATLSALPGPSLVVLGLRADFYGHALRYPELATALQQRQVVVGPMTREQVRRAITEPARRANLALDDGLAELLLDDIAPRGWDGDAAVGHEAGALPLLSHALLTTWERSRGGRLTVAGYRASGGIGHAVTRTAEAAYGSLGADEREVARQMFLRLVHVTDDSRLVRARMPLDELPGYASDGAAGEGPADGADSAQDGVLARFVAERLVTLDKDTAEITHEVLLSAWPRLREWIDAGREAMLAGRHITSAARAWLDAGRDEAALLRGGPLATARELAADPVNAAGLSPLAREFVDTGAAHEETQRAAQRRRTGRLRRLVAALTVLVLATGGLAVYAFQQRHDAVAARDQADSREAAVEAEQVRSEDPSLAAQLSLAAYRIAPTRGALASLLESAASPAAARLRDSSGVVESVALGQNHRLLAVAGADGTLRMWNVTSPGHPVPFGPSLTRRADGALYTVALSPDGRLLAAGGAGRAIQVWDVSDPRYPVRVGRPLTGPRNTVYSVAFSPSGRILAAGSADGTVRMWDLADPAHPRLLGSPLTGPAGYVEAVAFSPDGRVLAVGSADKTVRLWDVASPAHPRPLGRPLTGPGGIVDAVAFSPDGRTLAAGSRGNKVWLWNLANPARPVRARAPLTGATDWVNAVAFSPDGRTLAAASSDDRVLLWDTTTGALLAALPGPQPVTSLAWEDGRTLIAGGADGFVRLWTVPPPVLLAGGAVNGVSFGPSGRYLAVAGPDLQVWDTATRTQVGSASVRGAFPNTVAFAPGGSMLAAGFSDGTVRLWHVTTGGRLTPLGGPLRASNTGLTEYVTFSHDGKLLASAGDDGTVRLWNVADPARPRPLALIHDSGIYYVFSVAFSPDERTLAAASADNLTRLWDVSDPARPRLLGRPLAGPTSYAISVAFSPDGRVLAVGSADKTVRLWDVASPARPRPLGAPLTGPGGYVYSIAFSPSGTALAAGATDGTTWLWDTADPARPVLVTDVTDMTGAADHVYTVAFGPHGTMLAVGSSDGSVRLWDTRPGAAAAAVCATAGQPLTRAAWARYIPGRPYSPPCHH